MSRLKKILLVVVVLFIGIQFIQSARTTNSQVKSADITNSVDVPEAIERILKTSCYDCHSNNTRYPWYGNVQPIGWFLANHINEGKAELNFSDFGNYSKRRQVSKLKVTHNSIQDGSMPLSSYTLLHQDAKLSKTENALLMEWALKTADSISTKDKTTIKQH